MDKYEFLMSFKVWEQDIYFDYQLLLSMQLTCEMQKIDMFLVRLIHNVRILSSITELHLLIFD